MSSGALSAKTVVFVLTFLLAAGVRSLTGSVSDHASSLHELTKVIGPSVSGGFLYLIAGLNLVVLYGIVQLLRELLSYMLEQPSAVTREPVEMPVVGESRVQRMGATAPSNRRPP